MNLDKYIKLAEGMVIAAEKYIEEKNKFENYKDSLTEEEFKLMISESKESKETCKKIQDLEDRFCKAERKIKFY